MSDPPERPAPPAPSLWDRLAALLDTEQGSETVRLLRQAGALRVPAEPAPELGDFHGAVKAASGEAGEAGEAGEVGASSAGLAGLRPIGPWAPRREGDAISFAVDYAHPEAWWRSMATPEVLPAAPAPSTFRVCLVGESAAAGMFYAPQATPAQSLELALSHVASRLAPRGAGGPARRCEVIDLTRNSAWLELLVDRADAAAQLAPDVVVFFAGNNFFGSEQVSREGAAGRSLAQVNAAGEGGFRGLVAGFQARLEARVRDAVSGLAGALASKGVRMVFVLPASCDRWERPRPVGWLGAGKTTTWHRHFAEASAALAGARPADALRLAREMIALDGGDCATSQRVAANALVALGRKDEAVAHLLRESSVANALRVGFPVPGPNAGVNEVLRDVAREHGFACVDLRRVLAEHAGDPILDWRFFLDYCHLTSEGFAVLAAAVAAAIVDRADPATDWRPILAEAPRLAVRPEVEARARLEAAIYGSHLHQRLDLEADTASVRAGFDRALATSPDSAAAALEEYMTCRHPAIVPELSPAAHRLGASANHGGNDPGMKRWMPGMDRPALETIAAALEAAGKPGKAALRAYLDGHWQQLVQGGVDLVHPAFHEHYTLIRSYEGGADLELAEIVRSVWPRTDFGFVSDGERALALRLTCRLPAIAAAREGEVVVRVNGREIGRAAAASAWTQHRLVARADDLAPGFNRLTLEWPPLPPDDDAAIQKATRAFQDGAPADWFPVFGEVFSLRCSLA